MIDAQRMQDSGRSGERALAMLLPAGIIVLDEHANVDFASPLACELLGARDMDEVRDTWSGIGSQLGIAEWPRELAAGAIHSGRADVATSAGPRAVRFEVHATAERARPRIVLLRERGSLLPADRALLLASEAQASRHVLGGLVHAAKNPLNNFSLTLALLEAGVARMDASPPTSATRERWLRYLEIMRNEAARLTACIDAVDALAAPRPSSSEAIDACAMLRDVVHVLHHEATLREVRLEIDVPGAPVLVTGDPRLVRLALISFTIGLLGATPPDGRVAWRVASDGDASAASLSITATPSTLATAFATELFRVSRIAESANAIEIAARMIIEAQGGDVSVERDATGPIGLRLRMPACDPPR